ncbi:MAG: hypothetical protein HWN67_22625 [Candidatus Helarchaeota archaeon]|nr:hypothetical protein [Candidatus Helarchaeota archaeon]
MSKKYSKEFNDYLEKFNELGSIDYISREFLGLMRQKCYNCNKSRVECAFQPHCENRKYMNIMIEMKVNLSDIPAFCYSQQLRNIQDFLDGKAHLIEPIDYKLFFSDFIKLLNIKLEIESKNYDKLFNEIITKINKLKGKIYKIQRKEDKINYFLLIADGIIYYFDLKKEIVTINLQNKAIETEYELKDVIELYSKYFNIEIEIIEEMTGWWYLKASIPSKKLKSDKIINDYKEKIQEFSEFVNFFHDDSLIYFLIDIKTPLNQNRKLYKLTVSKLGEIFKSLNELSKKVA